MITRSRRRLISATVRYAILSIWVVVAFFTIYWMVSTSFKPDIQWFAWPPVYFPDPPTLATYMHVWLRAEQFFQTAKAISPPTAVVSLWNTTVIAFSSTFLAVAF